MRFLFYPLFVVVIILTSLTLLVKYHRLKQEVLRTEFKALYYTVEAKIRIESIRRQKVQKEFDDKLQRTLERLDTALLLEFPDDPAKRQEIKEELNPFQ